MKTTVIVRGWLVQIVLLACVLGVSALYARAEDGSENSSAKFSAEAAATFNKRCTACHTYGKGIKVGPDLKGVNERRKRDWLLKFIHASSLVIKSGDPTATSLFTQFKQQRMPDWTDLSDAQIADILSYIAIGGPDIKPADERSAELATAADIETGRQLFVGQVPLKYGAVACNSCHSVPGAGLGGNLGPSLNQIYFRYQDRALTEFLRHPCFGWDVAGPSGQYLTTRESFALKAFLRDVAVHQQSGTSRASGNAVPGQIAGTASDKHPEPFSGAVDQKRGPR